MKARKLRSPDRGWFSGTLATVVVLALVAGWTFYTRQVGRRSIEGALTDGAREELAALAIPAVKMAEIERGWVSEESSSDSLIAPVGPMPCSSVTTKLPARERRVATDAMIAATIPDADARVEQLAVISDNSPDNLLLAQMLSTTLIEMGRFPEAERVLTRALDHTGNDEAIIRAARASSSIDLDDVSLSTVIHVHHALGVARLSESSSEPPWVSLKNVIGSVKPLSQRRLLGTTRGEPAWSRLLIAAPGCGESGGARPSLSSYDLFNNLVVGYMRGKYTATTQDRDREFGRPRKNYQSALHKLLFIQLERAKANDWQNEAQLWALSNVERIVDWRMPDDARLAFNAVQVIDWWTASARCPADVCPPEVIADVQKVRDQLIEQALRRRNVSEEQRGAFARGAVRLLATSSLDRARVADAVGSMRDWLPPAERGVLEALLAADAARRALPRWLFASNIEEETALAGGEAEPEAPPYAKLGTRSDRWYEAALTDATAVVARWASQRSPKEQRAALVAVRQLLGSAEAPPELIALEAQQSFLDRLHLRIMSSKIFWAILGICIGGVVAFVLLWIVVHVREALLLRVSLYSVEQDYLAQIDRKHER